MRPRMTRTVCIVAALAAALFVTLRAEENLRIVPIVSGDEVIVSFELQDAYDDEVRQAIDSGLKTTFTYDLELRMIVPAWVDRTIATATVRTSDQYDNLTRQRV